MNVVCSKMFEVLIVTDFNALFVLECRSVKKIEILSINIFNAFSYDVR